MDRRTWQATNSPWGHKELDNGVTNTFTFTWASPVMLVVKNAPADAGDRLRIIKLKELLTSHVSCNKILLESCSLFENLGTSSALST